MMDVYRSQIQWQRPAPAGQARSRCLRVAGALSALLLVCCSVLSGVHAAPAKRAPEPVTADDVFLAARDAVRAGDLDGANALALRLAALDPNYLLAPYIDYWVLNQRLKGSTDVPGDDAVRAFMAKNEGTVVADLARRDWLLAIAKREDFLLFDAEYPKFALNDDPQVSCYALLTQYLRHLRRREDWPESALNQARTALLVPRDIQGDGCMALATTLISAGRLDANDLWDGIRLASDANQPTAAKRYAALLPAADIPAPKTLDAIFDKPALWLAKQNGEKVRGANRQLIVLALARMARSEPEQTAGLFERSWASKLPNAERGYVWAQIGAAAAKKQLVEASEWSRRSLDARGLPEDLMAWHARAALRVQDWRLLRLFIERMPPEMRRPAAAEGTWTYWLGRVAKTEGNTAEANTLFASIAGQYNFYGQLAQEELGQRVTLPVRPLPPTDAEIASASNLPGFARAFKFYQLNLRPQGNLEWNFSLRGMSDRELLAAAEYARRNAYYDRTVNTADRTRNEHDFTLRFLAPYRDALAPKAAQAGLDVEWVYGLIRQESRFVTVARSSVGASGLMQLMPATARYVAKKIGMTDFQPGQVADLDTNLTLGTSYLRMVLDDLDGLPVLATAAYNAGPGRARQWRSTLVKPVDGAIFAETIPFSETRDYVKKVMSNAVYYSMVFEPARAIPLKTRIGTISPKGTSAPDDLP